MPDKSFYLMKTFVYFIATLCISCGCLIAATNTQHPWALFVAAFGLWAVFFRGWNRRLKKQEAQRAMERQFREYMREKTAHHRRY